MPGPDGVWLLVLAVLLLVGLSLLASWWSDYFGRR